MRITRGQPALDAALLWPLPTQGSGDLLQYVRQPAARLDAGSEHYRPAETFRVVRRQSAFGKEQAGTVGHDIWECVGFVEWFAEGCIAQALRPAGAVMWTLKSGWCLLSRSPKEGVR